MAWTTSVRGCSSSPDGSHDRNWQAAAEQVKQEESGEADLLWVGVRRRICRAQPLLRHAPAAQAKSLAFATCSCGCQELSVIAHSRPGEQAPPACGLGEVDTRMEASRHSRDLEPEVTALANSGWRWWVRQPLDLARAPRDALPGRPRLSGQRVWPAVALSDGAGTAERSQYGRILLYRLLDVLLLPWIGHAHRASTWRRRCAPPSLPQSALESLAEIEESLRHTHYPQFAVATDDRLAVGQLGDGAVVAGESPRSSSW